MNYNTSLINIHIYLVVQNSFIIINLKPFFKSILENNFNISNIFITYNIKDILLAHNAAKNIKNYYLNNKIFKNKITKLDMFIGNYNDFNK